MCRRLAASPLYVAGRDGRLRCWTALLACWTLAPTPSTTCCASARGAYAGTLPPASELHDPLTARAGTASARTGTSGTWWGRVGALPRMIRAMALGSRRRGRMPACACRRTTSAKATRRAMNHAGSNCSQRGGAKLRRDYANAHIVHRHTWRPESSQRRSGDWALQLVKLRFARLRSELVVVASTLLRQLADACASSGISLLLLLLDLTRPLSRAPFACDGGVQQSASGGPRKAHLAGQRSEPATAKPTDATRPCVGWLCSTSVLARQAAVPSECWRATNAHAQKSRHRRWRAR